MGLASKPLRRLSQAGRSWHWWRASSAGRQGRLGHALLGFVPGDRQHRQQHSSLFHPGHVHAHRLSCAGRSWHPWAPFSKGQARAFGTCSAAAHVSERAAWTAARLPSCTASCHGPDAATKYPGLLNSALLCLVINKCASVRNLHDPWRSGWSYSVLKSRAAHRLCLLHTPLCASTCLLTYDVCRSMSRCGKKWLHLEK